VLLLHITDLCFPLPFYQLSRSDIWWFFVFQKKTEMSSSRPAHSSSSSSRTRQSSRARILAQTTLDAELNAEYEESGDSFDYSKLVEAQRSTPPEQQGRSEKVIAYLQHIQRGKLIQPFGCLLALDEKSFRVIAFSENAPENAHNGQPCCAER
jgi:hypothetical protein